MITNIFKRVEQKYILDEKKFLKFQGMLDEYFCHDKYYESSIYNLYFDNNNGDMIINSIDKPKYKYKIRLRSYGVPKNNDVVFLEMKQKYDGIVYKRRVGLTLRDYNRYFKKKVFPKENMQVLREIDYYMRYYRLRPYVFIAYDRLSYFSRDDINFRITFDTNVRSRFNDLRLVDTSDNKFYFDNKVYIMEVKSLHGLPLWFTKFLSDNKIYPISFSKVGNIYEKERGRRYVGEYFE